MATRTQRITGMAVAVIALLAWTSSAAVPSSCIPSQTSSQWTAGPLSSRTSAVSVDDRPAAVVRVDNLAAVRAQYLRFAEDRAAAVFSSIGARIIWIDEDSAIQQGISAPLTLVLLRTENTPGGQSSLFVDALGLAAPQVRRAYVFYDRIEALNASSNSILGILGDVMAHELGHLLLPLPGHSPDGIMRPTVKIKLAPAVTFSKSQALEVRCRLRQLR